MLLETFHTVGARCRLDEPRHIEPLQAMMAEPRQRDPQVFRQLPLNTLQASSLRRIPRCVWAQATTWPASSAAKTRYAKRPIAASGANRPLCRWQGCNRRPDALHRRRGRQARHHCQLRRAGAHSMSQKAIDSMLSQRRSLCAAAACSGLGWPRVEAEDIGGAEAVKAMEIA